MQLAALVLAAALAAGPSGAAHEALPAFEGGMEEIQVRATAYTSGPESTGKGPGHPLYGITATGTRAREGQTIAVDPRRIPLGSRVYVEELDRTFIAEDTGGAIRDRRIDLYMEKVSDALNWGVRTVRIRVTPQI